MDSKSEQLTTDGTKAVPTAVAPVEQMKNCERLSTVEKDASALHKNIAEKGNNAYYFAHNRSYEIPAHAKIITGPGLVAGGAPQRLSGPNETANDPSEEGLANENGTPMEVEPSGNCDEAPQKEVEPEAITLK